MDRPALEENDADYMEKNPYNIELKHPVEAALELASITSTHNNYKKFKEARKTVLCYLEPQYKNIATASTLMATYVKDLKTDKATFDPEDGPKWNSWRLKPEEIVFHIEDYAKSLVCDVPNYVRYRIRKVKDWFDNAYISLPREMSIMKMD